MVEASGIVISVLYWTISPPRTSMLSDVLLRISSMWPAALVSAVMSESLVTSMGSWIMGECGKASRGVSR